MIKEIQAVTQRAVEASRAGKEFTQQAGQAFENIKLQVRQTSSEVSEIAAAAEEQAATSDQAAKAVQNVAAISEESSAGAEETASATQSLANLAVELQQSAAMYRI